MVKKDFVEPGIAKCHEPSSMKDKLILTAPVSSFHCRGLFSPVFITRTCISQCDNSSLENFLTATYLSVSVESYSKITFPCDFHTNTSLIYVYVPIFVFSLFSQNRWRKKYWQNATRAWCRHARTTRPALWSLEVISCATACRVFTVNCASIWLTRATEILVETEALANYWRKVDSGTVSLTYTARRRSPIIPSNTSGYSLVVLCLRMRSCVCPAGFTGDRCETNIDDCAGNKCENNATCVDSVQSYECKCKPGFMGKRFLHFYATSEWWKRTLVFEVGSTYLSVSVTSRFYAGVYCEAKIPFCSKEYNACQNGARCIDHETHYTCECAAGFTGVNCTTNIDDCVNHLCQVRAYRHTYTHTTPSTPAYRIYVLSWILFVLCRTEVFA